MLLFCAFGFLALRNPVLPQALPDLHKDDGVVREKWGEGLKGEGNEAKRYRVFEAR